MAFNRIAAVYDMLANPERRLAREGAFLARWAGNGARILELACGTGIHAEFLARSGARVVACDLAASMIEYAQRTRSHPGIRYEVRDMRQPPTGPFDRVMILGNSLNLLPTREDVARTLAGIHRQLAPGGRLLLQLLNPEAEGNGRARQIVRTATLDDREVLVIKSMVPNAGRRFLALTYFVRPPGNSAGEDAEAAYQSGTEHAVLLDLKAEELEALLRGAGFHSTSLRGGLDDSPLVIGRSADIIADAGLA